MRRHADELGELNARFNALIENLPHGVSFYDCVDTLIVANQRFGELYGFKSVKPLIGAPFSVVASKIVAGGITISPDARLRAELSVTGGGEVANSVIELPRGRVLSIHGLRTPDGGWLSTHLDITEPRRAERQIAFLADHDLLTGLGNRALFARELESAIEDARRGQDFAVMVLDLDHFKFVNDQLGHSFGDELLRQVAHRLRETLGSSRCVARLGGDEFVAIAEAAAADTTAERLVAALSEPYDLEGRRAEVSVSIGVAVAPGDGDTSRDLLRAADLAMYRTKVEGRHGYRFFEPEMDERMQRRRELESDMREAIASEKFQVHFQPIVNVKSGKIVSFEALLRWNHPTRGPISPVDFIPLAEDSGMIAELGAIALKRACREAARWPKEIKVSVNLSPRQFNGGRLLADIVAALANSHLPPTRLELEITERVMLVNTEATLATLSQLRALGVSIAMDDFGAGYSSLSYLRSFPFDKIKIDQAFVSDLARDPDSISIVRAIADLARALRMTTTAEGVETKEQFDLLRGEGCTEIQGYYISRPAPMNG